MGVLTLYSRIPPPLPYIELLHFALLNLRRTLAGVITITELDGPQRSPLPPLSLQTVYRPLLQIFHLLPQYSFPLFQGDTGVEIFTRPVAVAYRGRWPDRKTHDLERVEIWERFARNDQL